MYRHGRHHRQHIYEVSPLGRPENDRLVATCMTEEDAERIVTALNERANREGRMSDEQKPLPKDDPRIIAWEKFKSTKEFRKALQWALRMKYSDDNPIPDEFREQHVLGALWLAFMRGLEQGKWI